MSAQRDLLRVTCKCAIFNQDGTRVLLADYGGEGYGLPGGHIDHDETPDAAMEREIFEELGVRDISFRRVDFFLHRNGKIVLGFVARLDEATKFTYQFEEINGAVWHDVESIENGAVQVPSYREFILAHRP